jgi:competence ComEA-like helix-hairpin-helix protein
MKKILVNLMHVNRGERNGAFALILLGLLALLAPEMYRWAMPNSESVDFAGFESDVEKFRFAMHHAGQANDTSTAHAPAALFAFNPNTVSFEDFVRLGLSERTAKSICNYRDKGGKFRKPEDFKKIYTLSDADYERLLPYIRLGEEGGDRSRLYAEGHDRSSKKERLAAQQFNFDPNTATESELLQLGLPKWVTSRVLNYREKGGKFRKKEDLSKIYGFPKEDYERLEPFIAIAAAGEASRPQASFSASGSSGANNYPQKNFAPAGPLDINRAGVEHWQMLPGIGEKRAQMIVKYRERLGGFVSVTQVGELRGLPDSVYQRIRPMLVLQFSEPRRLNINVLNTQELDAHPYITPRQASLIVADRSQNGNYQKVEDLLRIPVLFDKAWLDKIRPYLDVR